MQDSAARIEAYFATGRLPDLPQGHFIDGRELAAASGERLSSIDPGRGRVFAEFAAGDVRDVVLAVAAAERGFEQWRRTRPVARGRLLARMAALLRADLDRLAIVDTVDSGKTLAESRDDVETAARYFEYYAGVVDKLEGRSFPLGQDCASWSVRDPVGVTAHIIPWNYPTSTFARGIAPALAAGCAVVAKPAETTPFTALLMARMLSEAGLPDGVVNVVTGLGRQAGESLVAHPAVRQVTFTGSVPTGIRVMQMAAPNVTRLTLELGGKSPLIALDDCDLDATAEGVVSAIYANSGQVCSAGSRLVVARSVHASLLARVVARARRIRIGHGLRNPDMGALNSKEHLARVAAHVDDARRRGRSIVTGGAALTDPTTGEGYFFAPTIVDDLPIDDALVQTEVFGPVLAVQIVDDDAAALAAANGTDYALVAGIYTRDLARGLRLARDLEAGQVTLNDYWAGGVELPFGGSRRSGFGREKGLEGLDAYLRTKTITARL